MSEPLKPSVLIQNRRGRVFKVNGTTLFYSLREAIQKAREIVQDDDHRILYGESNTFHTLDQYDGEALIARADPPPPPLRQHREREIVAHGT